jgi:Baseplate J-like protein
MPLPLPSLDRRTFGELVAEGRSLIPRRAPQWTDHNVHDPGVTLLELFAWLVEMDIYRLDRVSVAAQRAFLRLLDIEVTPPQVAETLVTFSASSIGTIPLPSGSPVTDTVSAIVFQTAHELNVSPAKLTAVFTGRDTPATEITAANQPDGQRYQPFGPAPQPGDALYLGFDRPLAEAAGEISLYVWTGSPSERQTRAALIAEWEAAKAELGEACVPHWSLHYSARTIWEYRGPGAVWAPLENIVDETRALSLGGPVRFAAPAAHEADGERFWIRCRLLAGHFECPPEIDFIALNAVIVRHEESVAEQQVGTSTGRAAQLFDLSSSPVVAGSTSLRVMLGADEDQPWSEAQVWDLAGPHDRVYLLTPERGEIVFGNGRAGRVPPAGAKIFCRYRIGGGPEGNIPAGLLTAAALPALTVVQPCAAAGGALAETLAEAKGRALAALSRIYRAVTLADFEALALRIPGVPVARVRALAGHHPAVPCFEAPGCVSVVVVPNCPEARPEPGPDMLQAVKRHLDRRRTLATELHVTGPGYTLVAVHARLHGADGKALRNRALAALNEFFHPLRGGPDGGGWPVGRDVYRPEVLALLARIPGVEFVDRFGLQAEGDPEPRCGNVPVCASHLVASGAHQIEVVERRLNT